MGAQAIYTALHIKYARETRMKRKGHGGGEGWFRSEERNKMFRRTSGVSGISSVGKKLAKGH
jgi:hypothetical protein